MTEEKGMTQSFPTKNNKNYKFLIIFIFNRNVGNDYIIPKYLRLKTIKISSLLIKKEWNNHSF